ncbi:hypothetical protein KFE25_005140 [Diacronema lutheri]|uniref:HSF-type DNA-binding domain-containing protein n=1 Tax=Diacronema lutheri TaxID=2081491 RepID=A0A8J5X834_DIALT|nr:hypothetical protein KFE25_005140 [Diacronema lutheri]
MDLMVSRDAAPEADSPAVNFIAKLFAMISDPELGGVVCWNPAGDALQIPHPGAFAHSVLPKFFKHNRTRSFIRQLNLYGFRRRARGSIVLEFYHPHFRRGHADELPLIVRQKRGVSIASWPRSNALAMHGVESGSTLSADTLVDLQHAQQEATTRIDAIAEQLSTLDAVMRRLDALEHDVHGHMVLSRLANIEQRVEHMVSNAAQRHFAALAQHGQQQWAYPAAGCAHSSPAGAAFHAPAPRAAVQQHHPHPQQHYQQAQPPPPHQHQQCSTAYGMWCTAGAPHACSFPGGGTACACRSADHAYPPPLSGTVAPMAMWVQRAAVEAGGSLSGVVQPRLSSSQQQPFDFGTVAAFATVPGSVASPHRVHAAAAPCDNAVHARQLRWDPSGRADKSGEDLA